MPLNERAPVIRRQSVSRPDLWPHTQVDDPSQIRDFRRSRGNSLVSPVSPRRTVRAGVQLPELPISPASPHRQSRVETLVDEGDEQISSERKKGRKQSPKGKSRRHARSRSPYSQESSRSGSEERGSSRKLGSPFRKGKKKKKKKDR